MILTLTISVKSANAQVTYVWNGGTSGTWNVASNWKVNGSTASAYPGGTSATNDVAQIVTNNATITYSGNLTIGQLQTSGYGIAGLTIQFSGTSPTLAIKNGLSAAQPNGAAVGIQFTGSGTATIGGTSSFSYQASMTIGSGTTVSFTTGSILDFTSNQGTFKNNGTLNLIGCNFKIGSSSSLVSPGDIIANNSTFDINSTPAFITYGGKFVANTCTFNVPSGGYIKSTSTSSAFTATTSIFNLTGSGGSAYIYNNGAYVDHGSTYNITGQGANIQNAVSTATMRFRGSSISFGATGGSNNQNITNSGTLTIDSASSINAASYTSYITNSGTFYAGTSGSACVISLSGQQATITNNSLFYLGSTSIIYPSSYQATVTNKSGATFTLQSDANGSAAIGALSSTATCGGTFNVERFFQGNATYDNVKGRWLGRNYRLTSSPVNTGSKVNNNYIYSLNYVVGSTAGQTATANSATNAFITGCVGGSTSAGNPSAYLYNQNNTPSNATFTSGNFVGITNITSASSIGTSAGSGYTIPVGNGVLFFFRGAATNWASRTAAPYVAPEDVTLTATGSINQQSVTVKDWDTPTSQYLAYTVTAGNTKVRGFNMVGNPYPCTIDWNTINTGGINITSINPTIYEFNPVTNQYDTYISTGANSGTATGNGSSKIVSGQGFFVQANNNLNALIVTPSLTFNETAKAATSQLAGGNLLMGAPLAQTPSQLLRLKLVIDSLNFDDIAIAFNSTASAKYNSSEDALYLEGISAMEGLSSLSADSVRLSVNSLPLPTKQTAQVIKLFVTGRKSGLYTLQRTALDAIPAIYQVWLMDNYKKDSLDIRNNTNYAFNIDLNDTTSFGANRFTIVIRQDPSLAVHLLAFTATKATNGVQVTWKTENEQNYTNFTVERSNDNGVTFAVLGGFNSGAMGTYSFTDKNPADGANQYRLRIEDLNGAITFSNVVTLTFGAGSTSASNISVYPNPSSNVINLAISQSAIPSNYISSLQKSGGLQGFGTTSATTASSNTIYAIKIINSTGSVIKSATSTTPQWQASVGNLLPGTYIIQVLNNSDNSLVGKSTFVKM